MFEEQKEDALYWLTSKFDATHQAKKLALIFFIGLSGNIFSWVVGLFKPEVIYRVMDSSGNSKSVAFYYLIAIPFFFAFLMGLSLSKFFFRRKNSAIVSEDDFLNGYSDYLQRENNRLAYFIAGITGGVNAILLTFSVIAFHNL